MIPSSRRLTLTLAFPIGSTVHLKCRPERLPGIVVGIVLRQATISYVVAWGDATEGAHYGPELSARWEPDFDAEDTDRGEGDDDGS